MRALIEIAGTIGCLAGMVAAVAWRMRASVLPENTFMA